MKLDNTKNTTRNVFSGIIANICLVGLQFVFRTVFINKLGAEYLGLNSLFGSILSILDMAELGICTAITYCMYKPIAENDTKTICALMNYIKKCYYVIGVIVLVAGLAVMPFLRVLIKDGIPEHLNLYLLYILSLCNIVIPYFLFTYLIILLSAFQRNDIKTNAAIITSFIQYGIQILLLIMFKNYYLYLIMNTIFTVLGIVLSAKLTCKHFPQYRAAGKINSENRRVIFSKVKALLLYKISGVLSLALDSIIISFFLGLTLLGKYNNYLYIMNSVGGFIIIYTRSLTAGIGNNLILFGEDKNYLDFRVVSFLHNWIVSWCSICLLCLYQPFIKLWAGADYLLEFSTVICCVLFFSLRHKLLIINVYRDAVGIWDSDKFRPLISALFNLCLNIVLVKYWSINGVIVSTIAATIIFDYVWGTMIMMKQCFPNSIKELYTDIIKDITVTIIIACVTLFMTSLFSDTLTGFIVKMVLCIILPNMLMWLIYRKSKVYLNSLCIINRIQGGIRNKLIDFSLRLRGEI